MTKEEIKNYRIKTLNMSMAELSSQIGVSISSISAYENGHNRIPAWYRIVLETAKAGEKKSPGFKGSQKRRSDEYLAFTDSAIKKYYDRNGAQFVAEFVGEPKKYIMERASYLRAKGELG